MKEVNEPYQRLPHHPDFRPSDFGIGALFDSVRDGVVIGDAATERIVLWNSAAEAIFGYSADEALSMPLHALVPDEFQAQHRRGLVHYYETGKGLLIDSHAVLNLPGVRKDGKHIHLEFTLTPVTQAPEPSRYVVAILRDVTVRKEMEEELSRHREHLEEGLKKERAVSQRLTELDRLRNDFVAMVVHDLRNPLAAIRGLTKTLQRRWEQLSEEDRTSLLESMSSSASNLTELMDEVFLVARIESGEFSYDIRPFDLAELVKQAVEEQKGAHEAVPFVTDVPAPLPTALGDEKRQRQILHNLLSNAVKFSSPGSPVEVTIEIGEGELRLSVADHGPGIPPEAHDKLFKKFSRLEQPPGKQVHGTGLGLFICKQMIEAQGGQIEVDSSPGRGARFTYTVPLAPQPST